MMLTLFVFVSWGVGKGSNVINVIVLSDCINEDHVCDNDRKSLEHHCGRTGVIKVLHNQHLGIEVSGDVWQSKLKPCKQGRIIQCPLWRGLKTLKHQKLFKLLLKYVDVNAWVKFTLLYNRGWQHYQCLLYTLCCDYSLWGNTSWYHFDTGREWVIASQFRWTSKSVEWLQNMMFIQIY